MKTKRTTNNLPSTIPKLRLALLAPHMYMHPQIFSDVIFSPGHLAIWLAEELQKLGVEVTLFTPGQINGNFHSIHADLAHFEYELQQRGYGYLELFRKHPFLFATLARQVQAELVAKAYEQANQGRFDIVHSFMNEEELAMVNARLCLAPVVFTHHEPFNYLSKYRSIFPKYRHLPWISFSKAQRHSYSAGSNWVGNVYHGLPIDLLQPHSSRSQDYLAYLGRIIEPKGVHLAIAAAKKAGAKLKIAGKHYSGESKDAYWQKYIEPEIDGDQIEYVGFLGKIDEKNEFLAAAEALLMPSIWNEPFGLSMIEALACGTPVIGLANGAIPEVVDHEKTGFVAAEGANETETIDNLAKAIQSLEKIDRNDCRLSFENRFTAQRMAQQYIQIYRQQLLQNH